MISILPNMRLLGLSSENLGRDWSQKSQLIDELIQQEGLDLAEESVYLLFNRAPAAVAAAEGSCFIARPVIGPKRDFGSPWQTQDWISSSVYLEDLAGNDWENYLQEASEIWQELSRANRPLKKDFLFKLSRRMTPDLELKAQVVFHE